MTPDPNPSRAPLVERTRQLLEDARLAREAGDMRALHALAGAVLALDPSNEEAEQLLAATRERRQITLMFCDLVGSTAIAETRDPEEVSEILREYRDTCAEVLERFGGSVEAYRGDGMLVRFGYPEVHADDASRAVTSGLEMIRAIHERNRRLRVEYGLELQIRVALHTDLVLIEAGKVMGSAPNVAARLESIARPGEVVISDATHALVRDHFESESLGPLALRGVARPVEVFVVTAERAAGPLESVTALSPFVGRRDELARIEALWAMAPERGLRALLVSGSPGIGKSRLALEAACRLGARCMRCSCSSYHEATSLFPFMRVLERACEISEADRPDERLAKLRARTGGGPDLPLLATALGIPASAIAAPADVDPRKLRDVAVTTAAGLVAEHAGSAATVLFVDDLQWADPSSLDLISVLLATSSPDLFLLLTSREGFEPPWPETIVERLELTPLSDAELAQLADGIPEGSRLSLARRSELISRSDGVPLFLEELVRTADAIEQGRALHRSIDQADYAIPPGLRDPLLARLASPGVDLSLAQAAATIGRDVELDLLRRVSDLPADVFETRLDTLMAAGLVDRSARHAIRFRHELIREVAYETQPRSARRERHSIVADELLRQGDAHPHGDAGEAAFHLERAQRHEEALRAYVGAAQAAQALGAHTEAITRLSRAVALVAELPAGVERQQAELTVRQLRSFSAVMAGGYAAPEAAEDHARCLELCEALGLGPELVPSLTRSWSYYAFRGDLAAADEVTATMERALETGVVDFPLAFSGRGLADFFRGRFGDARRRLEAFVRHDWGHTDGAPPRMWQLPNDPLASVTAHLVLTLWIQGDSDAAEEMAERALRRAEGLRFPYGPFSSGYVHSLLAMTRRLDGDHEAAADHANAMIELGERHGFTLWRLAGQIQLLLSALHAGDHGRHDELVGAVAAWQHVLVAEVWLPYLLTELAVAQRAVARGEEALHSLDEALAVAARTGSDFYSAEALRIRGELTDRADDLEAALLKARQQDAALFELRSAMSLARMSHGSDASHEALETAIGRFSRDAHPRELEEARSLAAL